MTDYEDIVPEPVPEQTITISAKDAIIIHNIISTAQRMMMDLADDCDKMTIEWITGYLAVRGIAPIQERLYQLVKTIDTDALIKTGD